MEKKGLTSTRSLTAFGGLGRRKGRLRVTPHNRNGVLREEPTALASYREAGY